MLYFFQLHNQMENVLILIKNIRRNSLKANFIIQRSCYSKNRRIKESQSIYLKVLLTLQIFNFLFLLY